MENQLTVNKDIVSKLVLEGDLSKMLPDQKVQYYNSFCQSLGLNPLTQPFQLINFQGKQKLYATKDCTEQLRKLHGVSIIDVTATELRGVYVVTAKAQDKEGKTDAATGVVNVEGLKGDALANALMKAETKAKRRVTLSICGLGILDETETETIPGAKTVDIAHEDVPPVYPKEPEKKAIKQPAQGIAPELLQQWEQQINGCKTTQELLVLFNSNKDTINSEPQIYQLFTQRKKQVA